MVRFYTFIISTLSAASLSVMAEEVLHEEAIHPHGEPVWMADLIPDDAVFPQRWGLGIVGNNMDMIWEVKDVLVTTSDNTLILPDNETVVLNTTTMGVKGDVWLLPFMNVYFTWQDVEQDITLSGVYDTALEAFGTTKETLTGDAKTAGMVFAGGWGKFFANINIIYAETDLKSSLGTTLVSNAWVYQPRIGYNFQNVSAWVGGNYIDTESVYSFGVDGFTYYTFDVERGNIPDTIQNCVTNGPTSARCIASIQNTSTPSVERIQVQTDVDFEVALTKPTWSPVIGMHAFLSNSWEAAVEVYWGDRTGGNVSMSYRFQ